LTTPVFQLQEERNQLRDKISQHLKAKDDAQLKINELSEQLTYVLAERDRIKRAKERQEEMNKSLFENISRERAMYSEGSQTQIESFNTHYGALREAFDSRQVKVTELEKMLEKAKRFEDKVTQLEVEKAAREERIRVVEEELKRIKDRQTRDVDVESITRQPLFVEEGAEETEAYKQGIRHIVDSDERTGSVAMPTSPSDQTPKSYTVTIDPAQDLTAIFSQVFKQFDTDWRQLQHERRNRDMVANLTADRDSLAGQVERLRRQLETLEEERTSSNGICTFLSFRAYPLGMLILPVTGIRLRQQLQDSTRQLDATRRTLSSAREELKNTQSELENARQDASDKGDKINQLTQRLEVASQDEKEARLRMKRIQSIISETADPQRKPLPKPQGTTVRNASQKQGAAGAPKVVKRKPPTATAGPNPSKRPRVAANSANV
jgi:hypothetical protein